MKNVKPKKSLTECVIATVHINDQTILAKNRDRAYSPTMEVVHEIVDGVEVMYTHDLITDWSEGMNEHGIGIINSSLMVHYDEIEADIMTGKVDFDKDKKGVQPSYDGLKIRHALSLNKLSKVIESILQYTGKDKKDVGVKGMTMVANPKHAFVIELTSEHLPVIKKIDKPKVTVRTNHGIAYPETGYTSGIKRESSLSRMEIAKQQLLKLDNPLDILPTLSGQWNENPFLNPYRRDNELRMYTTSQVMMNLNDLKFYYTSDVNHSKFKGYVNKLPKGYKPKISLELVKKIK